MITIAEINKCRYFPEIVPGTQIVDIEFANQDAQMCDVRGFSPVLLTLRHLSFSSADEAAELHVYYDDKKTMIRPDAAYSCPDAAITPTRYELDMDIPARTYLSIRAKGLADVVTMPGITATGYSLLVNKPTVVEKLARGIPLDAEETELADRLDLRNSVAKGVLPLPLEYQLEREYVPIEELQQHEIAVIGGPSPVSTVRRYTVNPGECLILTGITLRGAPFANNVTITIDRDDDRGYAVLQAYALPQTRLLPCWIPALREIAITVSEGATVDLEPYPLSYTIRRVRLTNMLKARWGLVTREQLPKDVYDKVRGGVL